MKPTFQVRIWAIQHKKGRRRPYGVRWITAGHEHSEWFELSAQADNRRTDLKQAARKGEPFDIDTGLPESEFRQQASKSLLNLVRRFIDHEWDASAPNTRRRYVDTLAVAVAAFTRPTPGRPDERVLRRVLTTRLLPTNQRDQPLSEEQAVAAAWIEAASRPARELADKEALGALLRGLGSNLGGKKAAVGTTRTRRDALNHVLVFGVDVGELDSNPLMGRKLGTEKGSVEVDPRVVVNPQQARHLLTAVRQAGGREHLYGFFACMYYGALRPSEVNRLREADCKLPETGWGELILEKSASRTNARYSDTGALWEERSLKRRAQGAVRRVPIPPQLVEILRWHIDTFGTTEDGRLFRGKISGAPVNPTVYTDAWDKARRIGLSPEQYKSPLAGDPYDLRHAAVSTWLAAGVPAPEVAERAGHTVEVLLKVYAKCLDGQRDLSNTRIAATLGGDG